MFLERCLIFLIFGFFVFIADIGQWSSRAGIIMFTLNYIMWFALIVVTIKLSLRRHSSSELLDVAADLAPITSSHKIVDIADADANRSPDAP